MIDPSLKRNEKIFFFFFLSGRNCNNEANRNLLLQLLFIYLGNGRGKETWGDYAAEPEELAERKRRNFFPLFFVLIAPGALGEESKGTRGNETA